MEELEIEQVGEQQPPYPNFRVEYPSSHYTIKLYDYIEAPSEYKEHVDMLDMATENDLVVLDIASDGGDFTGFLVLFNALMRTKARTVAQVAFASSAGSMLMLSCDEIRMCPLGYMMNHTYSQGGSGYMKKPDIMSKAEFDNRYFRNIIHQLYQGFLTDSEVESMDNGADFYFDYEQVQNRLKNWVPIRKRAKS